MLCFLKKKSMKSTLNKNIVWHSSIIKKSDRETLSRHKAAALWFTGLSGSGKSTLANKVENTLFLKGCHTYVLDGDNVRHGLNGDLGFSPEDRKENIRRLSELVRLFVDSGSIVFSAFISPYQQDRENARKLLEPGEFVEIFCKCNLKECETRDPKGLYKKARAGEIQQFTGISSTYEDPQNPEITVNTGEQTIEQCANKIISYLEKKNIIPLDTL